VAVSLATKRAIAGEMRGLRDEMRLFTEHLASIKARYLETSAENKAEIRQIRDPAALNGYLTQSQAEIDALTAGLAGYLGESTWERD